MSFQCPPPLRLRGRPPHDPPTCAACALVIERGAGCIVLDTDFVLHPGCFDIWMLLPLPFQWPANLTRTIDERK